MNNRNSFSGFLFKKTLIFLQEIIGKVVKFNHGPAAVSVTKSAH